MTILNIEGFDGAASATGDTGSPDVVKYLKARYDGSYENGADVRVLDGWGSGYALSFGNDAYADSNYVICAIPERSTIITGFAFKPRSDHQGQYKIAGFENSVAGATQVRIWVAGNSIYANRGAYNSNLLAYATNVLPNNRWAYIEIKLVIDDTNGELYVKINGNTVISETGLDTRDSTSTTYADRVVLHGIEAGGPTEYDAATLFDDWYVLDTNGSAPYNDFLGPIKVEELTPNAAGDSAQFTPLSGSNYENVDETPSDDDTSYNYSSTTGNKDLFNVESLSKIDGTIYSVQVESVVRVDDATPIDIKNKVKAGTTEDNSSAHTVSSTSYLCEKDLWEDNPDDSSAWDVADITSLQIGYEVG